MKPPRSIRPLIYSNGKPEDWWVCFPWNSKTVKIPPEEKYYRQRTDRNRNLITLEEQTKFRNCKIGIAGLSVGSAILETLVLSGGPKRIKLADPDIVEISNLNRMRATLINLGQNKTEVAARRAWEIDPFADIELWTDGLKEESLDEFMTDLDIFIDEMDNLRLKVLSRLVCRRLKVAVVMVTDLGDKVMLDVERFDHEPERPIFHGSVNLNPEDLIEVSKDDWHKIASQIMGLENIPQRLIESVSDKSLKGAPQLGSTATMAGAVATYAIRQIACGYEMSSGRYFIDLEKLTQRP